MSLVTILYRFQKQFVPSRKDKGGKFFIAFQLDIPLGRKKGIEKEKAGGPIR